MPYADNYAVIDYLSRYPKDTDGKYKFELYWPELEGKTKGKYKGPKQIWKQSSSPLRLPHKQELDACVRLRHHRSEQQAPTRRQQQRLPHPGFDTHAANLSRLAGRVGTHPNFGKQQTIVAEALT